MTYLLLHHNHILHLLSTCSSFVIYNSCHTMRNTYELTHFKMYSTSIIQLKLLVHQSIFTKRTKSELQYTFSYCTIRFPISFSTCICFTLYNNFVELDRHMSQYMFRHITALSCSNNYLLLNGDVFQSIITMDMFELWYTHKCLSSFIN